MRMINFKKIIKIASAMLVLALAVPVLAAYMPSQGGTGTSTPPTYGQMLVGNAQGTYTLTATSSSGLGPAGSTGSIQYNNGGVFGGFGNWDGSTLSITGEVLADTMFFNDGFVGLDGDFSVNSADGIRFQSSGGGNFMVDNFGRVGINTPTPGAHLHVRGDFLVQNPDTEGYLYQQSADGADFTIQLGDISSVWTDTMISIGNGFELMVGTGMFVIRKNLGDPSYFTVLNDGNIETQLDSFLYFDGTSHNIGVTTESGNNLKFFTSADGQISFYGGGGGSILFKVDEALDTTEFYSEFILNGNPIGMNTQGATTGGGNLNMAAGGIYGVNDQYNLRTSVGGGDNHWANGNQYEINKIEAKDVDIFDFNTLGAEIVLNGNFATSANWTFGSGWTYDGANFEADHAANGTGTLTQTTVATEIGAWYSISYDVKNHTQGSITPSVAGVTLTTRGNNGTFTEIFRATANSSTLTFTVTATNDRYSIDNVSIKKVIGGNLNAAGNIGIGTSTPWARLSINPTADFGSTPSFFIGSTTSTTMIVNSTGKVGIGTSTPFAKFAIAGTLGASSASIFQVASSTNANLFSVDGAGHFATGGATPSVSSCGTSPAVSGNDSAGTVTVGTGGTLTCTVTFAVPFQSTPKVFVSPNSAVAVGVSAKSTTSFTITAGASLGSGTFDYFVTN